LKKKFLKKPVYVDSNIFIYPAIYDPDVIPESEKAETCSVR
jgi:hypothetical protein